MKVIERLQKSVTGRKKKIVLEELVSMFPAIQYLTVKDFPIEVWVLMEHLIQEHISTYAKSYARLDMDKFNSIARAEVA